MDAEPGCLRLDGILLDSSTVDYEGGLPLAEEALESLHSGRCQGAEYSGWVHLPVDAAMLQWERVQQVAGRLAAEYESIVVVGIGGSYIGAQALLQALADQCNAPHARPVHFLGTSLCPDHLAHQLDALRGQRYGVIVISKSGATLESALAFRLVLNAMRSDPYGLDPRRVVAITDATHGALAAMATSAGYERLAIPSSVGGRYSVLSPVGLLPFLLGGGDAEALLCGAQAAYHDVWQRREACELALRYAAMRNALYDAGKRVEVLATYTPFMRGFCEWYRQLYGESEGKACGGIYPTTVTYSTDLHSIGQYIQEGTPQLFETHLTFSAPLSGLSVPPLAGDPDGLGYLCGRPVQSANEAVYQAAVQAHRQGGVPCITLEAPRRTAYWMGYLIYFFQVSCAVGVLAQGHNPFDQPGVEAYKRNMFARLGKTSSPRA